MIKVRFMQVFTSFGVTFSVFSFKPHFEVDTDCHFKHFSGSSYRLLNLSEPNRAEPTTESLTMPKFACHLSSNYFNKLNRSIAWIEVMGWNVDGCRVVLNGLQTLQLNLCVAVNKTPQTGKTAFLSVSLSLSLSLALALSLSPLVVCFGKTVVQFVLL